MKWEKCGLIWEPRGEFPWNLSHATLPIAQTAGADRWWVYVSCRDAANKSRIGRLLLDASPLPESVPTVMQLELEPILSLGAPGTFDDSGVMPSWLVQEGDKVRLYYIGWNVSITVPYRISIGLAVSEDGGATFRRYSQGPIMDRSVFDPYFVTTPCVLREGDLWRMWYVSCTGWQEIDGRWEPSYHVRYAESADGIFWQPTGISCIEAPEGEAIARPCVFQQGQSYGMLYSQRSINNYRTDKDCGYRIGYATSDDGVHWQRVDEGAGIERSETGWDSEMTAYCSLHSHGQNTYMLYNGNGFGRSGFGLTRLVGW